MKNVSQFGLNVEIIDHVDDENIKNLPVPDNDDAGGICQYGTGSGVPVKQKSKYGICGFTLDFKWQQA